eukprot:Clim_evm37s147 gene=Clim_evmTU37s147
MSPSTERGFYTFSIPPYMKEKGKEDSLSSLHLESLFDMSSMKQHMAENKSSAVRAGANQDRETETRTTITSVNSLDEDQMSETETIDSTCKCNVSFCMEPAVIEVHSKDDYDRTGSKNPRLSLLQKLKIRDEMVKFKESMDIHEDSKHNIDRMNWLTRPAHQFF